MEIIRRNEIHKLVEAYQHTDNSDLDSEKTAVIQELLMEVERLEKGWGGSEKEGDSVPASAGGGGKTWPMT